MLIYVCRKVISFISTLILQENKARDMNKNIVPVFPRFCHTIDFIMKLKLKYLPSFFDHFSIHVNRYIFHRECRTSSISIWKKKSMISFKIEIPPQIRWSLQVLLERFSTKDNCDDKDKTATSRIIYKIKLVSKPVRHVIEVTSYSSSSNELNVCSTYVKPVKYIF